MTVEEKIKECALDVIQAAQGKNEFVKYSEVLPYFKGLCDMALLAGLITQEELKQIKVDVMTAEE